MSKSLFVKVTQGISIGPYSIYYNAVQPNNYAFLYGTTTNATNISLSLLTSGNGVRITIPSDATSVILENANGDCLNYKTFSIAEFRSVTSACTGYYDGTATINVVIDGDDDLYQYSRDGGVTFSASTAEKSYSFINVPNGSHNIVVKNVSDGVTISYDSNPIVITCAPALVTSFLGECFLNPPPEETYFAFIIISASGGSGTYKYAIQKTGGTKTTPQISNSFNNLDPVAEYTMFVYDVDNTVTPNYEKTVGTTTFNCPVPVPPVTFTTTVGCASTNYVGTGTVLANNFAGGTGVYMYIAFGTTDAEVRAILADSSGTTSRINLDGATSYFWKGLNNGSYFIGIQDSQSRITVVETPPVSCTVIEPPIKQFLAYNLITNTCTKFGAPTRYWTYDTSLADGFYKIDGSSTVLKLETATNIPQRGFKIDSIVSAPCVLTNVTLTPGITFSANQYLLLVNNVAYSEIVSGTNAFPAGSVVQLSFGAGTQICGVTLNGQPYTSSTGVTLVAGTNYNFVINAVNSYVAQGTVYCENNQSKQLFVNACGAQRIDTVTPCSTACTSTLFNETCSGPYGQNVSKQFYYSCNGVNVGPPITSTCGPCSITTQDWVEQPGSQSFCVPGDCNLRVVDKQMNPCAPEYNTTRSRNTFTVNCACGQTCANPPTYTETSLCGDFYSQTVTTRATCNQAIISEVNNICVAGCGATTIQEWQKIGVPECYGSCIKKQKERQVNYCATGYGTERFVDVGGASCDCGETCQGQETYNFCGGSDSKDLYTVQRYVCPPKSFIGTPQLVTLCSVPTCGTRDPTYTFVQSQGCYIPPTGSGNCVTGAVYRDTNRCSPTYNSYFILANGTYQNVGPGQPTPAPCNTGAVWINTGAFNCYGTCNSYYVQRDENKCSSTFGQTRQGALYQTNTTFCGGCCGLPTGQVQGAQVGTYWSCSGGVVSSAPVYENSNVCYTGPDRWLLNNAWLSPNPSNNQPSTNPVWENEGSPFCGTGGSLSTCQLYQKQVNINPCSSATVQYLDQGPSNSCGTWVAFSFCSPAYNVSPYTLVAGEENTCTGETRNVTYTNDSPQCREEVLQGFSMSASGADAITACDNEIGSFLNAFCLNGVPSIGRQIFDAAVDGNVYSDGFYHVDPNNWISITGGNGYVTSNGVCSF